MVVSINFYAKFIEHMGDDTMDMDTDTFDIILMNSTHAFSSANTLKTDIDGNEIPSGNGYTQGAKTLASIAWSETGGTTTFDAADITWSASGGDIPTSGDCTDAVIYDETATQVTDALMCSVDFDGAQTAGNGTDFKITWNGSGIFTIA